MKRHPSPHIRMHRCSVPPHRQPEPESEPDSPRRNSLARHNGAQNRPKPRRRQPPAAHDHPDAISPLCPLWPCGPPCMEVTREKNVCAATQNQAGAGIKTGGKERIHLPAGTEFQQPVHRNIHTECIIRFQGYIFKHQHQFLFFLRAKVIFFLTTFAFCA